MTEIKDPTQSPQDRMMAEVVNGADDEKSVDFSAKTILARGCDPQMARRASEVMPALLGGVEFVSCTDDDDFVAKLEERAWSVVFFAPGACRYNAARMPIQRCAASVSLTWNFGFAPWWGSGVPGGGVEVEGGRGL